MILEKVLPALWYGVITALIASVAGGILRTIQTNNYQLADIIRSLTAFNAPAFPPNGISSIFSLISYIAFGAVFYISSLNSEATSGFTLSANFIENRLLIVVALQILAFFIWPRFAYQTQATANQTELAIFDIGGTVSLYLNKIGNIAKVINPSNWSNDKLPFIIPLLITLASTIVLVLGVVFGLRERSILLLSISLANVLIIRLMLEILRDESLNNLS